MAKHKITGDMVSLTHAQIREAVRQVMLEFYDTIPNGRRLGTAKLMATVMDFVISGGSADNRMLPAVQIAAFGFVYQRLTSMHHALGTKKRPADVRTRRRLEKLIVQGMNWVMPLAQAIGQSADAFKFLYMTPASAMKRVISNKLAAETKAFLDANPTLSELLIKGTKIGTDIVEDLGDQISDDEMRDLVKNLNEAPDLATRIQERINERRTSAKKVDVEEESKSRNAELVDKSLTSEIMSDMQPFLRNAATSLLSILPPKDFSSAPINSPYGRILALLDALTEAMLGSKESQRAGFNKAARDQLTALLVELGAEKAAAREAANAQLDAVQRELKGMTLRRIIGWITGFDLHLDASMLLNGEAGVLGELEKAKDEASRLMTQLTEKSTALNATLHERDEAKEQLDYLSGETAHLENEKEVLNGLVADLAAEGIDAAGELESKQEELNTTTRDYNLLVASHIQLSEEHAELEKKATALLAERTALTMELEDVSFDLEALRKATVAGVSDEVRTGQVAFPARDPDTPEEELLPLTWATRTSTLTRRRLRSRVGSTRSPCRYAVETGIRTTWLTC